MLTHHREATQVPPSDRAGSGAIPSEFRIPDPTFPPPESASPDASHEPPPRYGPVLLQASGDREAEMVRRAARR